MKISVVVIIVTLTTSLWAQSGGTFLIEKNVIAGGGGQTAGGTFLLDGTIGQSLAGTTSAGGTFTIESGFWTSSVAPNTISGTITYGNALGNPPAPRFISNVTVAGAGSPNVSTTSDGLGATAGQYVLSGFGSGGYTVTPTKILGVNGAISSFDAGRIALHVAGPPNPQLNATQLLVADVSGNNTVTSFDAAMIAKYVAGPPYAAPGIGATATWRFTPVNRAYATVTSSVAGQDYTGLLMGDVSGNWANTGARPDNGGLMTQSQFAAATDQAKAQSSTGSDQEQSSDVNAKPDIIVNLPKITSHNKEIVVPVTVEGVANKGVIAYEFNLRYDPSVIQPLASAAEKIETVSQGLILVVNASEPGLLRIVMYGPKAISSDGVLLNLKFASAGTKGSVSPLTFERIMFNEGGFNVKTVDGQVELF